MLLAISNQLIQPISYYYFSLSEIFLGLANSISSTLDLDLVMMISTPLYTFPLNKLLSYNIKKETTN